MMTRTDDRSPGSDERPVIRFEAVEKRYGQTPILRGVDLSIRRGETVLLIGPSGCGKSTLLRCINALEPISAGRLEVLGETLGAPSLAINRFRASVGLVFQQFNLFPHRNVLDNITLGPIHVLKQSREVAEANGLALLAKVGLQEKAHAYPTALSGGQQQRVAIARALAMNPEILLLDEPTSALDPQMSREVLSVISDIAHHGLTLVIVSHDWSLATRIADRVVLMMAGRIEADGTVDSVFGAPPSTQAEAFLNCLQPGGETGRNFR